MTSTQPESSGDGLHLVYAWRDDVEALGKVAASVCFDGFSGTASAFFEDDALLLFASQLRSYPFGDAVVRVAGGYQEPVEEHVILTVQARGRRGQLGVLVQLATPSDDLSDGEWSRRQLSVEVLTTYEALGRFATEVEHLVRATATDAHLAAEVLA